MPEIVDKVTKNVKDRFQAILGVPEEGKSTLIAAKDELMNLQPAKAVVTILRRAGDGVLDMVDEQLDITRRWV